MGISDWAVLLRSDADTAYWLGEAAKGPRVRPLVVVRFVNRAASLHAYKFMPSGHYLILYSAAARSECTAWFDAAVRPGDVFTKPGGAYRPDGWDDCVDYAWDAEEGAPCGADVVSTDTWVIPQPPLAEWMVHFEGPEQLTATLNAVAAFNAAQRAALSLRVTRVVHHISGTKRLPPGLWLIAANADAGDETARWWKGEFQWKGRATAADAQSCHTIRRAKAVVWSASTPATCEGDGSATATEREAIPTELIIAAVSAATPLPAGGIQAPETSLAKRRRGGGNV